MRLCLNDLVLHSYAGEHERDGRDGVRGAERSLPDAANRAAVGGTRAKFTGQAEAGAVMILETPDPPSTTVAPENDVERWPDVLFLEDVARMLRVSRSTIERRRREGTFPIPELLSLDRRPRWSRQAVEHFLRSTPWSDSTRGRHRRRID
jgi:predicted DNA-binding transcriptional regulator AlpA